MADASAIYKSMKDIATAFCDSYVVACEKKDPKVFSLNVSKDCLRATSPPDFLIAMGHPADATLTRDQYEHITAIGMKAWSMTKVDIKNLTVDVEAKRAAAYTNYAGEFSDGTPTHRSLSWFLTFNEEGTEIVHIHQVVDTKEVTEFQAKTQTLLDGKGA